LLFILSFSFILLIRKLGGIGVMAK
jgi:hypothetical protein